MSYLDSYVSMKYVCSERDGKYVYLALNEREKVDGRGRVIVNSKQ